MTSMKYGYYGKDYYKILAKQKDDSVYIRISIKRTMVILVIDHMVTYRLLGT